MRSFGENTAQKQKTPSVWRGWYYGKTIKESKSKEFIMKDLKGIVCAAAGRYVKLRSIFSRSSANLNESQILDIELV